MTALNFTGVSLIIFEEIVEVLALENIESLETEVSTQL